MADYLVFTLTAPMGSFGGLAGHERRGSHSWPGRSAILGLVGAALGLRRDDAAGQCQLRDWRCAVAVLSDSHPLRDFHTVQTVPSKIRRPATRADALAKAKLESGANTVITRRDYRCDCAFGIAMWGGADPGAVEAALKTPRFTLYLGRKSCPLSAPTAPKQVQADSVEGALAQVTLPPFLAPVAPLAIASDEPLPGGWQETLWDEPLDRVAWHFGQRTGYVRGPEGGA